MIVLLHTLIKMVVLPDFLEVTGTSHHKYRRFFVVTLLLLLSSYKLLLRCKICLQPETEVPSPQMALNFPAL